MNELCGIDWFHSDDASESMRSELLAAFQAAAQLRRQRTKGKLTRLMNGLRFTVHFRLLRKACCLGWPLRSRFASTTRSGTHTHTHMNDKWIKRLCITSFVGSRALKSLPRKKKQIRDKKNASHKWRDNLLKGLCGPTNHRECHFLPAPTNWIVHSEFIEYITRIFNWQNPYRHQHDTGSTHTHTHTKKRLI